MRCRASLWALVGTMLGMLLASPRAAAQADFTVVALRYGEYVDTTVSAMLRRDTLLVPLRTVLTALGGVALLNDEGVQGTFEGQAFRVPLRGEAVRGRARMPLPSGWLVREDDLYVPSPLLPVLFGFGLSFDPHTLVATVVAPRRLPVAEAAARRDARAFLAAQQQPRPEAPLMPRPPEALARGAVVAYTLIAGRDNDRTVASVDLRGGAEVLGGSVETGLLGRLETGVPHPTNALLAPTAWHMAAQDPLFQYAGIGEIASQGLQSFGILGVVVTNAPYPVRTGFGDLPVTGLVAPRAEVEIYRSGRLIAFTRADDTGAFEVRVPTSYGTSEIEIRELEPGGGQRSTYRRVAVPPSLVPQGKVEYTMSTGFLQRGPLPVLDRPLLQRPLVQTQLAWGLTPSLTVRAGVERMELGVYSGTLAYAGTTARWRDYAVVSLDVAPGTYERVAGLVHAGRAANVQFQVERFPDFTSPYNFHGTRSSASVSGSAQVTPRLTLTLLAAQSHLADRTMMRSVQGTVGASMRRLFATISFGGRVRTPSDAPSVLEAARVEASVLLPLTNGPPLLRGGMLRGFAAADAERGRLERMGVGLQRGLGNGRRMNLSVGFRTVQQPGPMLSLELVSERPRADLALRAEQNGDQQRASVAVRSSGVVDPTSPHGAYFLRQNWVGAGGIHPVFFEDVDGDGHLSFRDRVFEGPSLILDGPGARFQLDQNARTAGLVPFYTYTARLDAGPIVDPSLVPLHATFRFLSTPNHLQRLEVPFVRGGDLTGALVPAPGFEDIVAIPEGMQVLFAKARGPEQRTYVFSDGSFERTGLLPGRYVVRLDPEQLRLAGLAAEPAEATVVIVGGRPVAPVRFALRPR